MSTALQPVHTLAPGANLEAYIQSVSAIPILSAEEERVLADRLYYHEDLEAARQLVMSHLRLVKTLYGYCAPHDFMGAIMIWALPSLRRHWH